jgi:1-deoxy-D-xylulose-5-phosphate synthase
MNLSDIKSPQDIKTLTIDELNSLSDQLRTALLEKLSHHGGHIGPNLGMVEAIVAMHYVFNSPIDKFVFDVSHQSYVHKMLTGRMDAFINPDDYDNVSGYTNPNESEHDMFTIGHTSTSVSLAGGLVVGRDMTNGSGNVIAVIGDGSLSGGEAFEGLDFAGTLKTNFIIIVNDNDMSIAENHGGLYTNLKLLRDTNGTAENNYFKTLGLDYMYVADGNNISDLIHAFQAVKDIDHPIVIHINTLKGKGYAPAEEHKEQFHWGMPFDLTTGKPLGDFSGETYASIFASHMTDVMAKDKAVATITAGTPGVIGFGPEQRAKVGSQFIDVGIAEQDAVALAAGMAKAGARPCFGVVSSFIQRAYDQLSQDAAIDGNPMVMNVFLGTIMGMNDVTHLGWFDTALISNIPGWVYLAPTNKQEYLAMLDWALAQRQYPVAIKVPGGAVIEAKGEVDRDYSDLNKFKVMREGEDVAIISVGAFFSLGEAAADILAEDGVNATLINPRYLSGIDKDLLESLKAKHSLVITVEDGMIDGGLGEKIARHFGTSDMRVKCYGVEKKFLDQYDHAQLLSECHLTPKLLASDIKTLLKK